MKFISPAILLPALLLLATGVVRSEGLHDQRTWTGKNGKAIEAKFESREGNLLVLTGRDGKTLKIDPANLSDNDVKWLESAETAASTPATAPATAPAQPNATGKPDEAAKSDGNKKPAPPPPLQVETPDGCSPVAVADTERPKIPRLNATSYDKEPGATVASSFITFLLFWKDQNVVGTSALQPGQDGTKMVDERNKWIKEAHTELIRAMRVHKLAKADFTKLTEEFSKFVKKDVRKGDYVFTIKTESDIRPENLARWTHGAYGTMLRVSDSVRGKPSEGFVLPLVSANANGTLKVNAWGTDMTVKMVAAPSGDGTYDLQIAESKSTPAWLGDEMHVLRVDPKNGDALYILAAFRKDDPKEKK